MKNIRFSKEEMKKAAKTVQSNVKKGLGQPKTLRMKDLNGNLHILKKNEYCGLFDNQASFFKKNHRLPNYTTLLYEVPTAFVGEKQPTSVECGDTTLANACTQLMIYVTVKKCKEVCKTTNNGTTPSNLIKGGEKVGVKIAKIPRSFDSVRRAIDYGYSVIAHIETAGNTRPSCLGYKFNYGHWISIYNYTINKKFKVYDPTRGYKECSAEQIVKATNGRDIHFYQVVPL